MKVSTKVIIAGLTFAGLLLLFRVRAAEQRVLSIHSGPGGSVSPPLGVHYYNLGSVVEINAYAEAGYVFLTWVGDVDASQSLLSSTTLTMDRDRSIIATFVLVD